MTLIIGKSANLSLHLDNHIENSVLISSEDPIPDLDQLQLEHNSTVNIIFNNFQKSTMLNNIDAPISYVNRALTCTSQILEYIVKQKLCIKKILYTSSSSVYGNNIFCKENDSLKPLNLHAALKVSNEKLLEAFCQKHNIDLTICRVFNMYGGHDQFSIISKVIRSIEQNETLTLFNNGNAIRDFIHIDDVVCIYLILLSLPNVPVVNIGTSNGLSVKYILDFLRSFGIKINYDSVYREELKVSTADNTLLKKHINSFDFMKVETYLLDILKHKKILNEEQCLSYNSKNTR